MTGSEHKPYRVPLEQVATALYPETPAMIAIGAVSHSLPAPDCESGYPIEQLVRELGEEHLGALQEYVMMRASVNCPEHGIVLYAVDAERYVEQRASRPK